MGLGQARGLEATAQRVGAGFARASGLPVSAGNRLISSPALDVTR